MQRNRDKLGAAVLLNAFVMPGLGHIVAGQPLKGILIGVISIALLFYPLLRFVFSLSEALTRISVNSGGTSRAILAISAAWKAEKCAIFWSLAVLAVVWILGVLDLVFQKRRARGIKGERP